MGMHRIKNVSFIGMAGCGKSTIGKALSKNLEINFTDTDLLIEEKFKASLEQIKKDNGYKFVRRAEEEVILSLDKDIKIKQIIVIKRFLKPFLACLPKPENHIKNGKKK